MNKEKIARAKNEAIRFLNRVAEWEGAQGKTWEYQGQAYYHDTPKQNGAVKRASMDLTRALADLRRGER